MTNFRKIDVSKSLILWSGLAVILWLSVLTPSVQAVPYFGQSFTYHQPDGSSFTVKLYGDEFFAYQRTQDGREIVRDAATGFWCYAALAADGRSFVSTGQPVISSVPGAPGAKQLLAAPANAAAPMQSLPADVVAQRVRDAQSNKRVDSKGRPLPPAEVLAASAARGVKPSPPDHTTVGSVVGLCVLVDFPDQEGNIPQSEVVDFCNKPSGYSNYHNACSVNEYYKIQSNNLFNYTNVVTAYVRMPNPKTYYDDSSAQTWGSSKAQQLVADALDGLIAAKFDFTQVTRDSNGYITSLNIFYAGTVQSSWSTGLWPHSWQIPTKIVDSQNNIFAANYEMSDMKDALEIGTFCHENGHMVCGYPDLYSYIPGGGGIVGNFSLMSSGSWGGGDGSHPTNIDPYLKYKSGWATVTELTYASYAPNASLQADVNKYFKYTNPSNSTEYFLLENRNSSGYEGVFGGALSAVAPGNGLAVWHIYEQGDNTYSSIQYNGSYLVPYEAMIVEATPTALVSPWYDDPFAEANQYDTFNYNQGANPLNDTTIPALKFWDPSTSHTAGLSLSSNFQISNYGQPGASITFTIGTYTAGGDLTVTINPADAVMAGAKWRRVGTTLWHDSGTTDYSIPPGDYTVEFKSTIGWLKPLNQPVVIVDGQTSTLDVTYLPWQALYWNEITPDAGFYQRYDHASVVFKDQLWVFGGWNAGYGQGAMNDVWSSYDGNSWLRRTNEASFSARDGLAATVFNNKIWLSGGYDTHGNALNDVWSSVDGLTWDVATTSASFSGRYRHQMISFNGKLWIIGGANRYGNSLNDVWSSYDGVTWVRATASANFSPRRRHTSFVFNDKMWVVAGHSNQASFTSDVWCSSNGVNWTQVTAAADFPPRRGHTSVVYDNRMWVIGGYTYDYYGNYYNDTWSSTDGQTWTPESIYGEFAPRYGHTSQVFNDQIWVIAGSGTSQSYNDVWSTSPPLLPRYGSLSAVLGPTGALRSGAQWRMQGTSTWLNTGDAIPNLLVGSYTAEFKDVVGWMTPSPQTVDVLANQTTTVTISYTPAGFITVNISPDGAALAGASWRRVGTTAWLASGQYDYTVPPGPQTIEFSPVSGWLTPANIPLEVVGTQTSVVNAVYSQAGSIAVSIAPDAAVTAGAKWRRAGTTNWMDSGTTDTMAPPGNCLVEFKEAPLWVTPGNLTVPVAAGQLTTLTAQYTNAGSLTVVLSPSGAALTGARWRIAGTTAWHASGESESSLHPTSHTLEFKDLPGWKTPASVSLLVAPITPTRYEAAYSLEDIYNQSQADYKITYKGCGPISVTSSTIPVITLLGNQAGTVKIERVKTTARSSSSLVDDPLSGVAYLRHCVAIAGFQISGTLRSLTSTNLSILQLRATSSIETLAMNYALAADVEARGYGKITMSLAPSSLTDSSPVQTRIRGTANGAGDEKAKITLTGVGLKEMLIPSQPVELTVSSKFSGMLSAIGNITGPVKAGSVLSLSVSGGDVTGNIMASSIKKLESKKTAGAGGSLGYADGTESLIWVMTGLPELPPTSTPDIASVSVANNINAIFVCGVKSIDPDGSNVAPNFKGSLKKIAISASDGAAQGEYWSKESEADTVIKSAPADKITELLPMSSLDLIGGVIPAP